MGPIKVVFDARMLRSSGIGTYTKNLIHCLKDIPQLHLRILGDPSKVLRDIPDFRGSITPFYAPIYSLKEHIQYPRIEKDEILHVPHYNAPFKYLRSHKAVIVTIHDIIHLRSKQFAWPHYRLYAYLSLIAISKWAYQILTVSQSSHKDLLKYFPKMQTKLSTIPNGFDSTHFQRHSIEERRDFLQRYKLPSQYLLHVGIGKKHKNVGFLVRALAPLWKNKAFSYPLVLAGCGTQIPPYVRKEISRKNVHTYIHLMGPLVFSDLTLLYECASLFLFPSLVEGFGFPILEAMACGLPVLCSNISTLTEVGGNAVLYFDPHNEADLQKKLNQVLTNSVLYRKLSRYGKDHLKAFSWEKHVTELLKVYYKAQKHFEKQSYSTVFTSKRQKGRL